MRIRDGFVTNSSSTSYIIISKNKLTGEYLAKKLGLTENSPNYENIVGVCRAMIHDGKYGFYHHDYDDSVNYEMVKSIFGKKTADKFKKSVKKGYEIYCGSISSEEDDYQVTICLDYILHCDSDVFIDATDNVW